MNRAVLVLGATSPIARGTAAALARRGHDLVLYGRDAEAMDRTAADLRTRYAVEARVRTFDAEDLESHGALMTDAFAAGDVEGVVVAVGRLGDQARAEADPAHAAEILRVNLGAAVSLLTHAANHLEEAGGGFIVGISSVAGDRGRQSNYVYGAAKGGLTVFLQGLRNRLAARGVHVLTVKPGFVDTRMTFGRPGTFAVAQPARIGEGIARALDHRRNVVYLPGFWRAIMGVIDAIPETVFKRLKL